MSTGSSCGSGGSGTRLNKIKELCNVLEAMSHQPMPVEAKGYLESVRKVLQSRMSNTLTEVVRREAEEERVIAAAEKFIDKWKGFIEFMQFVETREEFESLGNPFSRPPSTIPPPPPVTPSSSSPTSTVLADQ